MNYIASIIKRNILAIVFLILVLVIILTTYKDYGLPWDEKVFFDVGKYFVVKLFNFLGIPSNLSTGGFVPTPYHIIGHGVFPDILVVLTGLFFKNFNFETLHLIRALFSLPIFLLLYIIVSRLLNKYYALIGMLFLLLFPRFFGDMFTNAVDIPTTLFFTLSIAYFFYFLKTNQSIIKSIIFGFVLAITINQRLLFFYLPLLNFFFIFIVQKKKIKQFLFSQLIILLSIIFFMHITHPYLLTHPITGLYDIYISAKQYPWNAAVLFDGNFFQAVVKPLPWYYLPKSMLLTIPIVTLLLFLVGNLVLIYKYWKKPKNNYSIYILFIFYIPLLLDFLLKPTLYDSWRHFLFLTIPIIVISMFGLSWLMKIKIFPVKLLFLLFIFTNLFMTYQEMIILHPYEYIYYNSLVGGLRGAYGKYETDYWGEGFKEATLWFNQNINNTKKQYLILVEGDPLSSSYYFLPNMQLTIDDSQADYIFTFTRWNFHLRHPGKTIYTVKREGVPLIFVKEVNKI